MAKTIKGITIELEGKTSGLVKALGDVDKQLKTTQDALKQVDSALKLDPKNVEVLASKQKLLSDAIEQTKKKLELEQQAADKAREALAVGKITDADYATLISNVSKTASELDKMETEAKQTAEAIKTVDSNHIKKVGDEADSSKTKMLALKDATKLLKDGLTKVSKAAQSLVKGSLNSAVEYEDAFAGVMKTVDETAETSYDDISEAIKKMATETASTKAEIAGVAETAGQLGISADNIVDFTKTMIMLGDSTNLSANDAASALAKLFNVLDEDMDNAARAGSTIVDLGNNFATTENDIVSMATRLAATGAVVGLSTDQILAISTALSSVGIEAEAGGSAISKLLKKMDTATASYKKSKSIIDKTGMSLRELEMEQSHNALGFGATAQKLGLTRAELSSAISSVKSLNKYAEVSNMTAEQFVKAYGDNAVGALGAFIGGLKDVDANGGSATVTLQEMGLTEVRLSNAVLALATSDDILTKATQTASGAWEDNTALTEEAEKRYGTTASQIKQAQERFDNLKVELGEALLPVLTDLLEIVKDIIDWFNSLDDDTKDLMAKFLLFAAAIGPVTTAISGVITVVGTLTTAVAGAGGLGAALTAIASPGGAIALFVAGLAGIGIYVANTQKELKELQAQAERMQQAVSNQKQSLIDKYTATPNMGLAADVNSDEYKKAVAAYKILGLDYEAGRQQALQIQIELDGQNVAKSVTTKQAASNKQVYGGR